MSSRATPSLPENSGWANGGGDGRIGVEPHPGSNASTTRRSRFMTATLQSGQCFARHFQRPVDLLDRMGGADRPLLRGKRELVDAPLDQRAPEAAVEIEIM